MFSYGNKFKITIYGASHEETMGLIIDGLKAGITINSELINNDLKKRMPTSIGTTPRIEKDEFMITNGLFNGITTGGPLHIVVPNENIISKDYSNLYKHPRPGHADFVAYKKYNGYNDYRGGGFFSGRLTTLLVIAGAIAKQLLPFSFNSKLIQVGNLKEMDKLDKYLETIKQEGDSVGGIVELRVEKMIDGLGDPYFNKLDAEISKLIITIPGVRGILFGDNFDVTSLGSINNDLIIDGQGKTKTNHSGGINGGISNGNDLVFKVYVKPTSSIRIPQKTFNFETKKIENLEIKGRHDTAFVRRIPIVLENVTAIVLANFYL
ncbi:chorismate synthase [Haploplasma axanthum]|uniref:chorismate synthase n=1 Tax=Haploplasma axanthum TaxID=29552 RepID=A0A449BD10_HAPAX|nr:chorismate synthase [Haploplasma axanthum]VEU80351.1 Chorismate synthase [Haploplasma axanthum]